MAKQRWNRESAIDYLRTQPGFTPAKPLESYTTAYLKRTASAFQDAEQAGRQAPTSAERRGHARATVEHLSADKDKRILNQYRVKKPIDRDLDKADLTNLFKRAKRGKKEGDDVQVIITGVGQGSPRFKEKYKPDEIHSYSFSLKLYFLGEFIADMTDIYQFAESLSELEWEDVLEISFAFPSE